MWRILHSATPPCLPSLWLLPPTTGNYLEPQSLLLISVLLHLPGPSTPGPQSRLCSCLPFSSHSCIHTSITTLQMSCSMEPTSPWPKGASYSFSVSQHPTQHLILQLAKQLCSINANKAKLGLRPDLQVIKHEVGREGIGIVWEISEKGANKNN